MRVFLAVGLCLLSAAAIAAPPATAKTKNDKNVPPAPVASKAGIKTPGIQIPFDSLKAEAEIPVETPGWMTIADSVFVPSPSKDVLVRIDPKTNKALAPIADLKKPCSAAVSAFGSLWIPNCGSQTLIRLDTKANKVTATLSIGAGDAPMELAATADSLWMFTDNKTTLSRIDPLQNQVVGELRLPAGCNTVAFGESSLWVTCPSEKRILRINPVTNLVEQRIEVSAGARSLAFGAGSVWVLCDKDGKVDRIDPKTNKVVKTIELSVPNAGGNLAFGEGFLWVTQTGFPLTRIDPQSEKEKVVQQFWGEGGGVVSVTTGAIWLANVSKGTVWRIDPKRVVATLAE
jgi:virginiamycin B lyase